MLKGVEVIRRKCSLPVPQDSKSVIAYYTDLILKELRIINAFASFYPVVKKYVTEKLFSQKVDLDDPRVLYELSLPEVQQKLTKLFVETFRDRTFVEEKPQEIDLIKISDTKPFVWSKLVYPSNKCVFNYVPCENNFEEDFAKFLDRADDVVAFTKIVPKVGFYVEYKDSNKNLHLYYPDFVIVRDNGEHLIIETKGREDVDVVHKDKRIRLWCDDVTKITSSRWSYRRVDQKEFTKYRFSNIRELLQTLK